MIKGIKVIKEDKNNKKSWQKQKSIDNIVKQFLNKGLTKKEYEIIKMWNKFTYIDEDIKPQTKMQYKKIVITMVVGIILFLL